MQHLSLFLTSMCLIVLAAPTASGQGQMAFDVEDHDMGRLTEFEPETFVFEFRNAGNAPLTLVEVASNCGCTIPEYTIEAVAPGETGTVAVRYMTEGRPGPFEKAVRVVTDSDQAVTLRISGVVEPALASTGTSVGSLAFETVEKDLSTIPGGDALQTSIQFANTGTRPIRVERVDAPEGVDVVFPRGPVFPDHLGGLFVTVDDPGQLVDAEGAVTLDVAIVTDDATEPVKHLTIRARLGAPIGE